MLMHMHINLPSLCSADSASASASSESLGFSFFWPSSLCVCVNFHELDLIAFAYQVKFIGFPSRVVDSFEVKCARIIMHCM